MPTTFTNTTVTSFNGGGFVKPTVVSSTPIAPQGPVGPITPVTPQGPVAPNTPTVNPTNYDVFHMIHQKAIFDYVFQMEDLDVLEHFKEYMQVADIDMPACANVIIDKYGVNEIAGTNGDDYIFGLDGHDVIFGNGGDDALFADTAVALEWQEYHNVLVGDWDLRDVHLTINHFNDWTLSDGTWVPNGKFDALLNAKLTTAYDYTTKNVKSEKDGLNYGQEIPHEHERLESGDDILFGDDLKNVLIGDNVHRDYRYDGYRDGRDYDGREPHDIDAYSITFKTTETHVETLDLLEGHDWLFGMEGDDILVGDSWYENGIGYDITNDGNDLLNGGDGDDILFGDDGYVQGVHIPDSLGVMPSPHHFIDATNSNCTESHDRFPTYENLGNDILIGGNGNDTLYGGHGADTFVFDNYNGIDHVMDFALEDIIALTEDMFDVDLADVQNAINDFVAFTQTGINEITIYVDSDGLGNASDMQAVAVFHDSNAQFNAEDMLNSGHIILGDYI